MKYMSAAPQIAIVNTISRTVLPPASVRSSQSVQALDPAAAWKQLVARDANARFVYAVTTTGVFCRPGCGSRRPLRENVRFFRSAANAQSAGFRPCQRCRPTTAWASPLEKIRGHIESHLDRPVRLGELGRVAGLSPFTVQRLFKREMGVSPLQYQRAMRAGKFRGALQQGETVTDAIYSAGFSSSSRAYEGNQLGMTPARFAQGGHGERIGFASARTPFGWMIVGATERGLCWLSLADTKSEAEKSLRAEFPAATLRRDPSLSRLVDAALESVSAAATPLIQNENATKGGPARDGLPASRLAGASPDPTRRNAQLLAVGARNGRAQSHARGGSCLRTQPCCVARSLPSRGGRKRLAHRLPLGCGAQAKITRSRIEREEELLKAERA